MKVLVLIGGISKNSLNKRLFNNVRELAGDKLEFDVVDITALPYYSQDLDENMPPAATDLKARVKACDGLLFVTPEYNRGVPGVLKNAVDWCSRPIGSNSWEGKPAAIIGGSPSPMGTFGAQNQLRQVLTELSVNVMSAPRFYYTDDMKEGKVSDKAAQRLQAIIDAFIAWIAKLK